MYIIFVYSQSDLFHRLTCWGYTCCEGLPRWLSGTESACQHRRCRFDPWVGKIPWRRKWQPTLVFFPGEFHGQRSLVGCSLRGRKESDTTERPSTHTHAVHVLECGLHSLGPHFPGSLFHFIFQTFLASNSPLNMGISQGSARDSFFPSCFFLFSFV